MSNYIKTTLKDFGNFSLKATFVFFLIIITVLVSAQIIREAERSDIRRATYTIEGTAKRDVNPDKASISIGKREIGTDVLQIQESVNNSINMAIESLKDLGIDESNIRTSNYNVNPLYDWESNEIQNYSSDVNMVVDIENIEEDSDIIGEVIRLAAEAGLNQVRNINYEISNREEIIEELRIEAVRVATDKKDNLSDETGFELGGITNINYGGSGYINYNLDSFSQQRSIGSVSESADFDVNIQTGEDELSVTANVSFEIID